MTVIKLAQFEARGISSFIFTTTWATTEDGDDKNHKIMRVGHDIMIFDMYGHVVKLSMQSFLLWVCDGKECSTCMPRSAVAAEERLVWLSELVEMHVSIWKWVEPKPFEGTTANDLLYKWRNLWCEWEMSQFWKVSSQCNFLGLFCHFSGFDILLL